MLALASRAAPLVWLVRRWLCMRHADLQVDAFGLRFPTPIGLAAGLDKDAEAYPMRSSALGFGSVEVGTLTAEAQPGNPRPRLLRQTRARALINRMGFNNHGAAAAAAALSAAARSARAARHQHRQDQARGERSRARRLRAQR